MFFEGVKNIEVESDVTGSANIEQDIHDSVLIKTRSNKNSFFVSLRYILSRMESLCG